MRKIVFSFILACVPAFIVFSQKKQGESMFTLEQQVKINAHIEHLVNGGMLYEAAERRALSAIEGEKRVTTRTTPISAEPPAGSIWINRNPNDFSSHHPVYNNADAEYLVKNVLLSDPMAQSRITNVSFQGNISGITRSLAYFEKGSGLGIERGLILGTGNVLDAEGPNVSTNGLGRGYGGFSPIPDPHLGAIESEPLHNTVILEFDFQPYTDKITFDFIFASEEYPEFSISDFNDIFGFFIWEVGDDANYDNIALFPNGNPVAIRNSHWGSLGVNNLPTTPNTYTVLPSPLANAVESQWHVPNYDNSPIMEYDGRTTVLQAVAGNLNTEKKYRLKLAIANVSDWTYGSCIFLSNLDLGSAEIDFTNPYLSGDRATSQFHNTSAGIETISGGVETYVKDVIGSNSAWGPLAIEKYRGFLYSGCEYVIEEHQLKFEGPGNELILAACGDDKELYKDYLQLDGLYIGGEKVEYCYEGGTGNRKNITDYVFGYDTIIRGEAENGIIYFSMKQLPERLNGTAFGISGFVYNGDIKGLGDTVLFIGFSKVTSDVKYSPGGLFTAATLSLGLKGGSRYIRWATVDAADCNAEYNNDCRWRFLRNTQTGEELPFSEAEISRLYDGNGRVPIIIQEPGSCWVDTIWVGYDYVAPVIQRRVDLPKMDGTKTIPEPGEYYIESRKDFTFYATFDGAPLPIKAKGFYSNTIRDLDHNAELQADGSYKYTIRQVLEPWTIFVDESVNNQESVNNHYIGNRSVWAEGSTLYMNTDKPSTVKIYTLTGILIKKEEVNGRKTIQLSAGFYIIDIDNKQYKAIIK